MQYLSDVDCTDAYSELMKHHTPSESQYPEQQSALFLHVFQLGLQHFLFSHFKLPCTENL